MIFTDLAPENIEDLCDELESPEDATRIISSLNSTESGWLARCIREKSIRDREAAAEEIEQELQVRAMRHICRVKLTGAFAENMPAPRCPRF